VFREIACAYYYCTAIHTRTRRREHAFITEYLFLVLLPISSHTHDAFSVVVTFYYITPRVIPTTRTTLVVKNIAYTRISNLVQHHVRQQYDSQMHTTIPYMISSFLSQTNLLQLTAQRIDIFSSQYSFTPLPLPYSFLTFMLLQPCRVHFSCEFQLFDSNKICRLSSNLQVVEPSLERDSLFKNLNTPEIYVVNSVLYYYIIICRSNIIA